MDIEKILFWIVGVILILIIIYLIASGKGFT